MFDQIFSPVVCPHLIPVAEYLLAHGAKITYVGQAWSSNCRLWVYYDVVLDCEALIRRFELPPLVKMHEHKGAHEGSECGLYCEEHHDGLMGVHPEYAKGAAQPIRKIG